jgi:hypothetical protein
VHNTFISPLPQDEYATSSWNAEVADRPLQFVPFGHNGGDSAFGFWCTDGAVETSPVVEVIDGDWSPYCVHPASKSLTTFLLERTVYYLLLYGDVWEQVSEYGRAMAARVGRPEWEAALAALHVPAEILAFGSYLDDTHYDAVRRWTWPGAPKLKPAGWSTAEIQALFRADADAP